MARDPPEKLAGLAERFERFAEYEAAGYSPLYYTLCRSIAGDRELLELASKARPGQPVPNLFLGAVHYLLLRGSEHDLRHYYASLAEEAGPADEAFAAFRDFALGHATEIESLLGTRLVQTNEVGRSACLFPAFAQVAALADGSELAIIEIGPSAGLNLIFDRYGYTYGGLRTGVLDSPVQLRPELRGRAPRLLDLPRVAFRTGIDLNPLDVRDEDETVWLRSLVWPEHRERMKLLESAIEVARRDPPKLVRGEGAAMLASVAAEASADAALCVFHSFTLNQVPAEGRQRLFDTLLELSKERSVVCVSMASGGGPDAEVLLMQPDGGAWRTTTLARSHPHGLWLEWLA